MTFASDVPWCSRLPAGIDPAVAFVLTRTGGVKAARNLEADADLGHDTVRMWLYRPMRRHSHGPSIRAVRRALNAMGFDLAVVPLEQTRPQPKQLESVA